jgi:hypothetical protein
MTMRRLTDVHPGTAKTDARDALVIADATGNGPAPKERGWAFCSGGDQRIRGRDGYRCPPPAHVAPRRLRRRDPAELEVLVEFDDDPAGEADLIRGLLVTIHPALATALGPRPHHPAAWNR